MSGRAVLGNTAARPKAERLYSQYSPTTNLFPTEKHSTLIQKSSCMCFWAFWSLWYCRVYIDRVETLSRSRGHYP